MGAQGTLLEDAALMEEGLRADAESEQVGPWHGRVETHRCAVFEPTNRIRETRLKTIGKLTASRWDAGTEKGSSKS